MTPLTLLALTALTTATTAVPWAVPTASATPDATLNATHNATPSATALVSLDMSPLSFDDRYRGCSRASATLSATPSVTLSATLSATPSATALVSLDMSPLSFDDRYRGCSRAMAAALPALNRSELRGDFAEAWALAAAEWHIRMSPGSPVVSPLSPAQAVALLSYTAPLRLHRSFNAAVRGAGRSPRDYRDKFPFKTLHFLLTSALGTLRDSGGQRCHRVWRGVRGVRFRVSPGDRVRFGHFASASRRNQSAAAFGTDTTFEILTCQGAPIAEFSFFPLEDEVLIPPFETFRVTGVTRGDSDRVALRAEGTFSRYNCEWLRGQRCGDREGPCEFDSARSIPRSPPHLGGLLVATTALAVATGTL